MTSPLPAYWNICAQLGKVHEPHSALTPPRLEEPRSLCFMPFVISILFSVASSRRNRLGGPLLVQR